MTLEIIRNGLKEACIFDDACQLGEALSARIMRGVREAGEENRPYLLGCPAGRSGKSTYDAFAKSLRKEPVDCSRLVLVMMDEYLVETDAGFNYCPIDSHYSCRGFAEKEIRQRLNEALPLAWQIPLENLWTPNPHDLAEYEWRIEAAGGVDLFILASGASDGHVAFNPPGSSIESCTRIVEIAEQTRQDNLGTFPEFKSLDEVPRYGVSVGLKTLSLAKEMVLVIHGSGKQQAVSRLAQCEGFDSTWPVSMVFTCSHSHIYLDRDSIALLEPPQLLSPTR